MTKQLEMTWEEIAEKYGSRVASEALLPYARWQYFARHKYYCRHLVINNSNLPDLALIMQASFEVVIWQKSHLSYLSHF